MPEVTFNQTEFIRGLPVSTQSFEQVNEQLADWALRRDKTRYFACVNAHSAEEAHRDPEFMAALKQADLLVADGVGVVVASCILGGRIRHKTTGPDLFLALSERLHQVGGRSVFYLGATESTLQKIRGRHHECFENLRIAGTYSPPFRKTFSEADMRHMVDLVNEAAPDVLWIGLGAPKQEKWILRNLQQLRVPLCGPVGAVFDYFSGVVAMPPKWIDRAGLHWAYRLARNPRRLWLRNLDSPRFLAHVLRDRLRRRRSNLPSSEF